MPEAGWRKLTGEEEFRELRGHGGGSHPAVAVKFHLYQDTVEGLLELKWMGPTPRNFD